MHKGIILLTKAVNKAEAIWNVNSFLEHYGDWNVWDWYQIWGRWTGTLAPNVEKFYKFASKVMKNESWYWFTTKEIEEHQHELQAEWELMWMEWPNPYADHYLLPTDWGVYDVMLLKECQDTVKEWLWDLEKRAEEYWEKAVEERKEKKEKKEKWEFVSKRSDMSWYYAKKYSEAHYWEFCFDTNVYNIDTDEAESLPENMEWYRAVMVDMHN